jgi:hypothetical protein
MPKEKILGMSRIISNERVSELLCQKKLGKNCEKWRLLTVSIN